MLNLVLPKGSLEESILTLFRDAELSVRRDSDREYRGTIDDPRIGHVRILRPQEIPTYVSKGFFDVGVTGLDWVRETESDVAELLNLGRTVKLVLAVAESSPANSGKEMRPGSRISTEYPGITHRYFEQLGIPVEIFLSYGATEAKVPDIADAVVELTETGSTLRKNSLKIIDTVLTSSTRLIMNQDCIRRSREAELKPRTLKTLLEGALAARGRVLVKLNVGESHLERRDSRPAGDEGAHGVTALRQRLLRRGDGGGEGVHQHGSYRRSSALAPKTSSRSQSPRSSSSGRRRRASVPRSSC